MKSLSRWAAQHRTLSVSLLVLCWVVLNVLVIDTAWWMVAANTPLPQWIIPVGLALGIPAILLYPGQRQRKTGWRRISGYHWHKACDGALALSTILLLLAMTHRASAPLAPVNTSQPTATFTVLDFHPEQPQSRFEAWKHKWKQRLAPVLKPIREHAQHRIAQFKAVQNDLPIWARILLSVGALALGVVLWYLVAIWSCNLSCSGNETAALIVFVLGTAAILAGLVWGGILLWRNARKKETPGS